MQPHRSNIGEPEKMTMRHSFRRLVLEAVLFFVISLTAVKIGLANYERSIIDDNWLKNPGVVEKKAVQTATKSTDSSIKSVVYSGNMVMVRRCGDIVQMRVFSETETEELTKNARTMTQGDFAVYFENYLNRDRAQLIEVPFGERVVIPVDDTCKK